LRDDRRPRRPGPGELALFIAIPVPAQAAARVAALVDEIREGLDGAGNGHAVHGHGGRVRWVRFEGLHITIRFLGATGIDRIASLRGAIDGVAATTAPFDVGISGAGAFPSDARPRALWLGLSPGEVDLADVAERLEGELIARGWPPEARPFRAHLTVARTDGVRSEPMAAQALEAAAADLQLRFRADELVLFESRPAADHGPAEYHRVHAAPFASIADEPVTRPER